MSSNGEYQEQKHPLAYRPCRGTTGDCPYSLVDAEPVLQVMERVVREMIAAGTSRDCEGHAEVHRPRLRVAMAGCPNACTEPQTKDVGIIAIKVPTGVGPDCNGCGRCETVCREEAIRITDGKAQITPAQCVGCGQCIRECPVGAIHSQPVRFRILVGGRMGRHPRWAEQLCTADGADVVKAVRGFLDEVCRHVGPGERVANVAERIGVAGLRERMSIDV
jgi:anaerobic sulfite reductase subunit C